MKDSLPLSTVNATIFSNIIIFNINTQTKSYQPTLELWAHEDEPDGEVGCCLQMQFPGMDSL